MTPRTPTLAPGVARVLDALRDITDSAFEVVDLIAARTLDRLGTTPYPRRSVLAGVDEVVAEHLERRGAAVQGAGFVAAIGLLEDAAWWLEWFARGDDGRAHRLVCQTDPDGVGFYDYEYLPWYVVPRDTGRRHVTGPYVDYLCTDDYTLTFTVPLTVGDRFAGVAGADIGVHTAERLLLPALRAADQRLAVLNAHGRIVASNSGRHVCGDLVEELDVPSAWGDPAHPALHVLDDLPLGVLELDAAR